MGLQDINYRSGFVRMYGMAKPPVPSALTPQLATLATAVSFREGGPNKRDDASFCAVCRRDDLSFRVVPCSFLRRKRHTIPLFFFSFLLR